MCVKISLTHPPSSLPHNSATTVRGFWRPLAENAQRACVHGPLARRPRAQNNIELLGNTVVWGASPNFNHLTVPTYFALHTFCGVTLAAAAEDAAVASTGGCCWDVAFCSPPTHGGHLYRSTLSTSALLPMLMHVLWYHCAQ